MRSQTLDEFRRRLNGLTEAAIKAGENIITQTPIKVKVSLLVAKCPEVIMPKAKLIAARKPASESKVARKIIAANILKLGGNACPFTSL